MVSSSEIEELIVKLHKEGKTIREISKIVHKNYSYIGAVLRKRFPEEYENSITVSKETQALKLFSAKKTPTQVAIKLGSSTDETEKFYTNFWRLEGLFELYALYKEHSGNLKVFLHFFNELKERKITTRRGFKRVLNLIDVNRPTDELHGLVATSSQLSNNDSSECDVLA